MRGGEAERNLDPPAWKTYGSLYATRYVGERTKNNKRREAQKCQKADYTVRIQGSKQIDAKSLCEKIAEIIFIDNSERGNIKNKKGT